MSTQNPVLILPNPVDVNRYIGRLHRELRLARRLLRLSKEAREQLATVNPHEPHEPNLKPLPEPEVRA